jgi:hypothetical protein
MIIQNNDLKLRKHAHGPNESHKIEICILLNMISLQIFSDGLTKTTVFFNCNRPKITANHHYTVLFYAEM